MAAAADISLSHYSPGRLRLKAAGLRRDKALAEKIRSTLEAVPGIDRVSTKALTGSLLIEFSPDELAPPEASRRLLEALGELFPEAFSPDCIAVNIAGLAGRDKIADRITTSLAGVAAIRDVSVERGELQIHYDPATLSIPAVLDSLAG